MSRKYAVIFEQARANWAAYVPDLPGCVSTGKTLEETERNVREAISGHLQTLCEFGEPVPEPTSVAREIEVAPAAWGRQPHSQPVRALRRSTPNLSDSSRK
jgi:predicted RNase H-like HicB family nuclease